MSLIPNINKWGMMNKKTVELTHKIQWSSLRLQLQ